jgi:hypothetical protein
MDKGLKKSTKEDKQACLIYFKSGFIFRSEASRPLFSR